MNQKTQLPPAKIKIESIQKLKFGDLDDLCDATESAITEGGGFGWIEVPSRKKKNSTYFTCININ